MPSRYGSQWSENGYSDGSTSNGRVIAETTQ
jgi:hypothetical protein